MGLPKETPVNHWRRYYWLIAAVPPALLFIFEALRVSLYHIAASPNVSAMMQLGLWFALLAVWPLAPRAVWRIKETAQAKGDSPLVQLALFGCAAAAVHLLALTFVELILFSRAAWQWEPVHIIHRYGDVVLKYAGVWFLAYGLTVVLALAPRAQAHPQEKLLTRYEVRENGKTLSIPLSDIYWIKAAGNYVEFHTGRGVKMIRAKLQALTEELGDRGFLQSHRSALVNSAHVVAIKACSGGSHYVVQLSNEEEAPLSRRRLNAFKAILRTSG